jgi:hypothetical protein
MERNVFADIRKAWITTMSPSLYNDLVRQLKTDLTDFRSHATDFQAYDLAMEMMVQETFVSYSQKRKKGEKESLFYRRDMQSGAGAQLEEETAFKLFNHFMCLPQHIAITPISMDLTSVDLAEAVTIQWQFPVCAVHFSYRKKGAPKAVSTRMVFVGLNDENEALSYLERSTKPEWIVMERPLRSTAFWETSS